jgi:hypothetical protein
MFHKDSYMKWAHQYAFINLHMPIRCIVAHAMSLHCSGCGRRNSRATLTSLKQVYCHFVEIQDQRNKLVWIALLARLFTSYRQRANSLQQQPQAAVHYYT